MLQKSKRVITLALLLVTASACRILPVGPDDALIDSAFVVQGEEGASIARVLTAADSCPAIEIDGVAQAMQLRVAAAIIAARNGAQADSKAAAFPLRTCEAMLPRAAHSASVGGQVLPLAAAEVKRIVLIADTGCRLKLADKSFQDCRDPTIWPFAEVAKSAAALHPDLVIHLGDMHYRESPCPAGNAGCANSPWGFGMDVWAADFFAPARPLLRAAPWVFLRGNHETCARGGQGWFRFLDPRPWTEALSCNDPAFDGEADYSPPYRVPLNRDTQLIVFDSGRTGYKNTGPADHAYQKYLPQFRQVDSLVQQAPHNFFLSHQPVLAFGPIEGSDKLYPGNEGLQSVMRVLHPGRLFPAGVDLALHGHVHLFETLSFASDHPATFTLGNSGSENEGLLPPTLPDGLQPAPGALVAEYATRGGFGFASLENTPAGWRLTEFNVQGRAIFQCALLDGKSHCQQVGTE